jgi:hypothetical protein
MPTATVRYGRPKGSGLDDRQQLETIAALLVADPKLKPTTAIRSLGVEDPSTIRRLRDKFRHEQPQLLANAQLGGHAQVTRPVPANCNESAPAPKNMSTPQSTPSRAAPVVPQTSEVAPSTPAAALVGGWCDLTFSLMRTAAEAQAAFVQHWLELPAVESALRRQLALNSVAVAVFNRSRGRRRTFH